MDLSWRKCNKSSVNGFDSSQNDEIQRCNENESDMAESTENSDIEELGSPCYPKNLKTRKNDFCMFFIQKLHLYRLPVNATWTQCDYYYYADKNCLQFKEYYS